MASFVSHQQVFSNEFASLHLHQNALGGRVVDYLLTTHKPCSDIRQLFQSSEGLIKDLINNLSATYILYGRMIARVKCIRIDDRGERIEEIFLHFPSLPTSIINGEEGELWYSSHSIRIMQQIDSFVKNGSNLMIDCIDGVYVKLTLRNNSTD